MRSVHPERSRGALALLLTLVSSPAFACAVCGAGENDPSRGSYVVMSVIISLLPLAMLGGIVGYVVLKTRASEKPAGADDRSRST